MSLYGGYKVAMLRNAGHVGQSALLASIDDQHAERMTRHMVSDWEHLLAANIMHASRMWYATQLERLRQLHRAMLEQDGVERIVTWELHLFSGDGTNSSTVQSLKVQACRVSSCFHLPTPSCNSNDTGNAAQLEGDADGDLGLVSYTSYADVQFLPPPLWWAADVRGLWEAVVWRRSPALGHPPRPAPHASD
eukprot:15477987-Alexandrium_andersonii.AAC.1